MIYKALPYSAQKFSPTPEDLRQGFFIFQLSWNPSASKCSHHIPPIFCKGDADHPTMARTFNRSTGNYTGYLPNTFYFARDEATILKMYHETLDVLVHNRQVFLEQDLKSSQNYIKGLEERVKNHNIK